MASPFNLFGLFHREDRWVKERSLCQALVTKLEKSGILTLALKLSADAGGYLITTFITTFIAWTIFLVTWGVITKWQNSRGGGIPGFPPPLYKTLHNLQDLVAISN